MPTNEAGTAMSETEQKQCVHMKMYALVDRWLDEAKVAVAFGDTEDTASTLEECANEVAALLPPRGVAFHQKCNW
jgi:hypothetical protein